MAATSAQLAAAAIATPGTDATWWSFRAPAPHDSIACARARLFVDAREAAAIMLGAAPQDLRLVSVREGRP